jgi:ATP-dependent Clp protease ATP-binding subunit ClpC
VTHAARIDRSESELNVLRKLCIDFAAARKETATTVHLLAAVAARAGVGAELLLERGLDKDTLLKAGRSFGEEVPDAVGKILSEARHVAKRTRGSVSTDAEPKKATLSPDSRLVLLEPNGLHVLVALLADRTTAAHRALALSGVDVTRLRAVTLARSSGAVPARRAPPPAGPASVRRAPSASPRANEAAVVPLLPRSTPPPAPSSKATVVAVPPPRRPISSPPPALRAAPVRPPPPNARRPARRAPAPPEEAPPARSPERSKTPLIDALLKNDSSLLAARAVGRDEEALRTLDVLSKHRANAPCLVGPAGVGKTTVARAVGARLRAKGTRLVEVSTSGLLSGAGTRGALSERLSALFDEARESHDKFVFFFDDVHELLAAGEEAVFELKAELARGDVAILCATSAEAYRRHIESDAQLARRLVPIEIDEPAEEDALPMVRSAAEVLARHHALSYRDDAVASAIAWSIRYMPGRALPDKAIGALDLAGARARRTRGAGETEVTREVVAEVIADLADVPAERLLENDRQRLVGLEVELGKRVVGHSAELGRIASQLKKSAAGLRHARPLGSFLLLGPTGVGKTETAKAVAEVLFGSTDAMTRLDLSEFAEPHALARLIGAPPGYVGHEAGGQLTEAVKRRPYQVVLLDEIEKAHPEVMLSFLQVLDEGRLTDGRGRKIDFTNVVVVMTSNLGARAIAAERRGSAVGFARESSPDVRRLSGVALDAAKKHLPLELYGRIDEVLFFAPLERGEVAVVAERMLDRLAAAMAVRGVRLEIEAGVVEAILDAGGFDAELGARPLRRTIARLVEAPLADLILEGELDEGSVALVGVDGGEVIVDSVRESHVGKTSSAARTGT